MPVYILDETEAGKWELGGASRWWLHHSLAALDAGLQQYGSRLMLACGQAEDVLRTLGQALKTTTLFWNRRYEPAARKADDRIEASLKAEGWTVTSFNSSLLFEPHQIANKQGGPFQVFTPYWRHCLSLPVARPTKLRPGNFPAPKKWPSSLALAQLKLLPKLDWADGFSAVWQPGEPGAHVRLKKFLAEAIDDYSAGRNQPAVDATSRLSPWLHFGELGPRQVWEAVRALGESSGVFPSSKGAQVFLSEIGWREFAYHQLYHFPHTPEQPLRAKYAAFPWRSDPDGKLLRAWQRGRTGYPIVDAGMRQLWATGWMHNRVRMVVASFLVKHLRLSWTHGAAWFWDTLVDADLAANTLNWQWSAGSGADAAPYFRIFAPVLQGRKFDPDGEYVRRWVPELARLPKQVIHAPWEATPTVLSAAGVELGDTYPRPIVDHAEARAAALAAFKTLSPAK